MIPFRTYWFLLGFLCFTSCEQSNKCELSINELTKNINDEQWNEIKFITNVCSTLQTRHLDELNQSLKSIKNLGLTLQANSSTERTLNEGEENSKNREERDEISPKEEKVKTIYFAFEDIRRRNFNGEDPVLLKNEFDVLYSKEWAKISKSQEEIDTGKIGDSENNIAIIGAEIESSRVVNELDKIISKIDKESPDLLIIQYKKLLQEWDKIPNIEYKRKLEDDIINIGKSLNYKH